MLAEVLQGYRPLCLLSSSVVVPTRNDWKPGGNRIREEDTATAEEKTENVFISVGLPTRAA